MRDRPTANPTNRFAPTATVYDDGEAPPPSSLQLIDDSSRSILAHNDSPDVGFSWSVNPYRGCAHACSYCLHGDTPILLGDGRTRAIRDLRVGDEIYGTRFAGRYRYFVRTRVLAHWATVKPASRVRLADGTDLISSGDHRFLTERGWKHVLPLPAGQRPHLTSNNSLMGIGQLATTPPDEPAYRRGYLCGIIRGDATLKRYDRRGPRGRPWTQHSFRLALADYEALTRSQGYLAGIGIVTRAFEFVHAHGARRAMRAIAAGSKAAFEAITTMVAWPEVKSDAWHRGFAAGIFDAEGSHSGGALRIANGDPELVAQIAESVRHLGFDAVVEAGHEAPLRPVRYVRIRGGLPARMRFFHLTGPAITRKWDLEGRAIKTPRDLRVVSIEPLAVQELFDITTGTGDFIANGAVSHNCYARPSHEYLDMGAGTDFDTKIVVKRRAPELLREAFEKPSWRGEQVMFSGVTDCYQPAEKELQLTRQCLEVCLEYRNPVGLISKSALVLRDLGLLTELAKEAGLYVSVSVAFADAEPARAIEPWAPAPAKRFAVIEALAKAGIAVGVMCAPVMPGLNDDQMVRVLERAREAGATTAHWVLLRLPGAVATVFEERVRTAMPLAADKILHRIRETRGGEKLYDARFGARMRGEGVYAQTLAALFEATVTRLGFAHRGEHRQMESRFARPEKPKAQLSLF